MLFLYIQVKQVGTRAVFTVQSKSSEALCEKQTQCNHYVQHTPNIPLMLVHGSRYYLRSKNILFRFLFLVQEHCREVFCDNLIKGSFLQFCVFCADQVC